MSDDSQKQTLSVGANDASGALDAKMKELEIKKKEQIVQSNAASGVEYINLQDFPVDQEALAMISLEDAKRLQVLCIYQELGIRKIVAVHPEDKEVQAFIKTFGEEHKAKVSLMVASENSFNEALSLYDRIPKKIDTSTDVKITEEDLNRFQEQMKSIDDLNAAIKEASLTDKVSMILAGGLKSDASDIHIEAEESQIVVRLRIDGVLREVAVLPHSEWKQMISRLKLLAKMKINVTTASQDGRITIKLSKDSIDVRVSTIPTAHGESVVMRLLRSSQALFEFKDLGLRGSAFESLEKEIQRPNGMIITTGPTGSGKTTTLYAILNKLNDKETKIITLEDPIEYKVQGINQSQVDPKKDYTFAAGLRSILRQDPDVVMVGEMRDLETSETAVNAALTGHLVVSTLHTNDAAGAIPRFLSMGVKPFLLGPALNAVIGQRLVRKLCEKCKTPTPLNSELQTRLDTIIEDLPEGEKKNIPAEQTFYTAPGCDACQKSGYKGRVGVYELFVVNDDVEAVINSADLSEATMKAVAKKQGMVTMVQDGILKALEGITSVEEVFRVTE